MMMIIIRMIIGIGILMEKCEIYNLQYYLKNMAHRITIIVIIL